MKPYYTGDAEHRLKQLSSIGRRRVLAYARSLAVINRSDLDASPNMYAVTPIHIKQCGYTTRGERVARLTVRKQIEQAFIDYVISFNVQHPNAHSSQGLESNQIKKMMKMKGTYLHDAFQHFASGYSIGQSSKE